MVRVRIMSTRLYFNLVSAHDSLPDREGVEVVDVSQAQAILTIMVDELRQEDASTAEWSGWTLNVTDGVGRVLFSIPLVEEAADRARKSGSG
jgi:hypothetical protein